MKINILLDDYAGYTGKFYAQHGVSYLIQLENKNILFDTGQDAEIILHNMKLLSLDPSDIDLIFLSHCHYDHTGGLLGILKKIGRQVPVVAHPKLFRKNFVLKQGLREIGIPFRRNELEEYADFYLIKDNIKLADGVYSTGEVRERMEFENIGLDVYTLDKDGNLIKDNMNDDMSLYIETSDGLVIISGCSHAGIASIVRHATEISKYKDVKMVIGGFHLINADLERIKKTVQVFKELNVKEIYTGHCTGPRAEAYMLDKYKKKFHKLYSGMVIDI